MTRCRRRRLAIRLDGLGRHRARAEADDAVAVMLIQLARAIVILPEKPFYAAHNAAGFRAGQLLSSNSQDIASIGARLLSRHWASACACGNQSPTRRAATRRHHARCPLSSAWPRSPRPILESGGII